jgi:coenzyme PQQ synthesis protein D (PqqD)
MLALSDRVIAPAHVLIRHLDGESVLLNLETEKYFGLDGTGTRMWEIATGAPNLQSAYAALSEEFDVEPEVLRHNLLELLNQLLDHGLLQIVPSDVESVPAI